MLRELHSPCTPSNSDTSSASSLFSSSGDERSIISGRSGALQEIFSNIRLEQPSAERFCVDWESLFDLPDSPDCIAIDENGRIIAATVTKLVERLTSMVDIEFMNDFLMSFRAFLTPINLAEMLAFRLSYGFLNKSEAIKLRTFVVLRQWICHYYEIDFGDDDVKQPIIIAIHRIQSSKLELSLPDQQILGKLRKFINREELAPEELSALTSRDSASIVSAQRRRPAESMSSFDTMNNQSWVRKLGRRIRAVLHGNNNDDAMEDSYSLMAPSVETGQFSWFDGGSPTTYPWAKEDPSIKYEKHSCVAIEYTGVMAEHLCLIESKWFHSVSWTELLSYPQTEVSGHLMACIEHFNQMCQWMISEILRAPSHNEQALIIQKLIRISLKCLGYSNFNSVMQILLALQNPAVEGLLPAWKRLNEYERSLFEDMVVFVSPLRNFRNIRKAMELQELAPTPCIPFTGLYLSDLSSNKERPTNLKTDLIPWFKHQTAARIIRQFRAFQSVERLYSFNLRPDLYRHLMGCCQKVQEEQLQYCT